MKIWLEQSLKHVVPQSKLANALHYMHDRWQQLTNFLLDGALEIDNNGAENQIRPFASGRKNWLFSGSPRGAHASALKTFALAKHPMIILICCRSTSSQK